MPTREIEADGWRVRLDPADQVLGIEVPEYGYGPGGEDDILPALPPPGPGPVSAAALLFKAKRFDDGLVAAVDLAAQRGTGRLAGKAGLLRDWATALGPDPAAAPVLAAARLGGVPVDVPAGLESEVAGAVARFTADDRKAKPLGFYTWSPDLAALFRQDRYLQQPLDPAAADTLAAALGRVPGGPPAYAALLRLAARLTSPTAGPDLRDGGRDRSVFPASRSHEVRLVERLYGDRPIPPGFDLMTELVYRVRAGAVDLTPSPDSGWYDHQTWALEPLAAPDRAPEAPRLALGPRYRRHLEDLFRGALALARETHVKPGGMGVGGCAGPPDRPIYVRPDLSAEPVPEAYRRRAAGYRFCRGVLDEAFGDGWRDLRRWTVDGPVATPLGGELDQIEAVFLGAAAAADRDLGLDPPPGADDAIAAFGRWRAAVGDDPDVAGDARMMVPVFHDLGRRKTKVWAVLGWRAVPAQVTFRRPPKVVAVEPATAPPPPPDDRYAALRRKFRKAADPAPAGPPRVEVAGTWYTFFVPVLAEAYGTRLLDRDEFRRHCDRYKTRAAILRALD